MTHPGEALEPIELRITDEEAGERLDRVLAARDLGLSRAVLQRLIADGKVQVDGHAPSQREPARAGATVSIFVEPPPPMDAEPEDLPLDVLYEDAHLVVIDKKAGMVVHPAPGHPRGTLVNAILYHFGVEGASGDRPGIVHRLDKDTSGVMVVARSTAAHEALSRAFADHDIDRRYHALVRGLFPKEQTYDTLHARHPKDRKRFSSLVSRGRRAVTVVRPLETLFGSTLVECTLHTGRTHQIRVHLSEAGHAILADSLYGRTPRDPRLSRVAQALGRQALHAAVLGFAHPVTQEPMHFETPPPADFQAALDALRGD